MLDNALLWGYTLCMDNTTKEATMNKQEYREAINKRDSRIGKLEEEIKRLKYNLMHAEYKASQYDSLVERLQK